MISSAISLYLYFTCLGHNPAHPDESDFAMPPAARLTDMHVCPMVTPGVPPIPHVGGPVEGPGAPTVLTACMPQAVMGDSCVCVGPPDTIVKCSMTVMVCSKPAARMGDMTVHGGNIVVGAPTVMIGG